MSESEIIQYLKENKNKGVIFYCMPDDVKDWCFIQQDLSIFTVFKPGEGWTKTTKDFIMSAGCTIALPEEFKLEERSESGWVEFEIKDSCFAYSHSIGSSHLFDWFEWEFFLKSSKKQGWGFTNFGGWQYEEDGAWHTSPQLFLVDDPKGEYHIGIYADGEEAEKVKPLIPIKIRFWREKK